MFDITAQWHHDILRSWQLSHFKVKKVLNPFFWPKFSKKWDKSWASLDKWMDKPVLFSQRRILPQLFRVDPKRIDVARNLVFFKFFFQFCFPKIVELFLRNPNPNLTLTPTLPRVIFEEEELRGSDLRDLSFARRKLTICDD